jgi:hypothetical protein
MEENLSLISLIHDITQAGYRLVFDDDFEGMIQVTYMTESGDEYLRHSHLGFPGSKREHLAKSLIKDLQSFLEEIKKGEPKRDGIAESVNKNLKK